VILKWSQGQRFAAGLSEETLGPGQSWSFSGEVQLGDTTECRFPPGAYVVRIYLTADKVARALLSFNVSARGLSAAPRSGP